MFARVKMVKNHSYLQIDETDGKENLSKNESSPPSGTCRRVYYCHVFCSFLALKLMKELEMRIQKHGSECEWNSIKQDLCTLKEAELHCEESTWYLLTDLRGCCPEVLKAAGVAVPPSFRK